jgi:hypothetical protein
MGEFNKINRHRAAETKDRIIVNIKEPWIYTDSLLLPWGKMEIMNNLICLTKKIRYL